ncbi:MAG: hypothetical protein GX621_09130, partial [Pirellulaceae bacterium]|nr:hypothetical protein [Pirellulaceae bacterium]
MNQSIIAYTDPLTDPSFANAIEAARTRENDGTQGGGDGPESAVEALYQTATGAGFDGNGDLPGDPNYTTESGPAGLYQTQVHPGTSGDVPAFNTFQADATDHILAPAGTLGGVGFRAGALTIVLVATDNRTGYEPEDTPTGKPVDGLIHGVTDVDYDEFTEYGRGASPDVDNDGFGDGARIQETVTALNSLGVRVIGLGSSGTFFEVSPAESMLNAFAKATGAIYDDTQPLANGRIDGVTNSYISPGDPLYFSLDTYSYSIWTDDDLAESLAAGIVSQLVVTPGSITGTVWNDINDNRVRETGESHVSEITVFLDSNGNGELDEGEYRTTSDTNGVYVFTNLAPRTYDVRVVLPPGYEQTTAKQNGQQIVVVNPGAIVTNEDIGINESRASDDSFETNEDTELPILVSELLDNDDDDGLLFHTFTQPRHGTLTLMEHEPLEGPTLLYMPGKDYYGVDSFRYSLTDGEGYYDWVTVTINVVPVNDAPEIVAASPMRMLTNGTIGGRMAIDVDDATLAHSLRGPNVGTLSIEEDGTFTYAPPADWTGVARFEVRFTDGEDYSPWTDFAIYVCEVIVGETPEALVNVDAPQNANWGAAIAANGSMAIFGATGSMAAPVLIHQFDGDDWNEVASFEPPTPSGDFGYSVAISGNTAIVGAPFHGVSAIGGVYVLADEGVGWAQSALLTAEDWAEGEAQYYSQFGYAVAISDDGNTIVVGAAHADVEVGSETYYDSGIVYVYQRTEGVWECVAKLAPSDRVEYAYFGSAVDISGDKIVIGAYQADDRLPPGDGSAYVFERQGDGTWMQKHKLTASDADGLDYDAMHFGHSVAIDEDRVVVGAPQCSIDQGGSIAYNAGAVYYFELSAGSLLTETAKWDLGAGANGSDYFGQAVDIRGSEVLVGAPGRVTHDWPSTTTSELFVFDAGNPTA